MSDLDGAAERDWRSKYQRVIFEADTTAGKVFDVVLIAAILLSILVVMLESVSGVRDRWGDALRVAEWAFTILFTVEYVLRLVCAERPLRYARSFFGIVDLVAVVPTYASILVPGAQAMLVVRIARMLRVFRVLKLANYVRESETLWRALFSSRRKIAVFVFAVFALVVVFGSLMYLIEGPENGFTSIPRGVYWAIVTLTTVGYGDISPRTDLGQAVASLIMVLGYGIIAVPTGIVTAELAAASVRPMQQRKCASCAAPLHDAGAIFCSQCGARLP